jgi:hypothetical protein
MGHQLLGDLFRERRIKSSSDIDCRQLLLLARFVGFEFRSFKLEFGLFRVCGQKRTRRQPST